MLPVRTRTNLRVAHGVDGSGRERQGQYQLVDGLVSDARARLFRIRFEGAVFVYSPIFEILIHPHISACPGRWWPL